jgi:hypothetical protein
LKITSTAFFQGFHRLRVRTFVFSKPWFRVFLLSLLISVPRTQRRGRLMSHIFKRWLMTHEPRFPKSL